MTEAPYVTHVPVMTGGYGRGEVRRFYRSYFIGGWPADTQLKPNLIATLVQLSTTVFTSEILTRPTCGPQPAQEVIASYRA